MTDPHQEVDQFIASLSPEKQKIMGRLREIVHTAVPEAIEEIKWGHPVYTFHGLLCYMSPEKNYVSFGFFNGAKLQDPDHQLKGTGKKLRHIKIAAIDEIPVFKLQHWIQQSVQLNVP